MQKLTSYLLTTCALFSPVHTHLHADGAPQENHTIRYQNTNAFTGKVVRDRVRLRTQPSLDSPVVKELKKGDMLVIVGETDGFYEVQPPSDFKAFIYRTFILDGVVEGNRVNVRISPDLESPVIAQLNAGDRVNGKISHENNKWYEVTPPVSTRFYISTDFINNIGDAQYLARYERRKDEVNNLLNTTYLSSQSELQKPFRDIEPDAIIANYQKVINTYPEFTDSITQAREYLAQFQDAYLRKKVEYLETNTKDSSDGWNTKAAQLNRENLAQKERLSKLEKQLQQTSQVNTASTIYEQWVSEKFASEIDARMAIWIPVEISHYEQWTRENNDGSIKDFYNQQKHQAITIRGILEPYDRPIRNKPGDFLLVNKTNRLPIAYVYSTHINLQELIGREITIEGVLRPNNNFAYPAYFVISAN